MRVDVPQSQASGTPSTVPIGDKAAANGVAISAGRDIVLTGVAIVDGRYRFAAARLTG
jgi:hypothetical protein